MNNSSISSIQNLELTHKFKEFLEDTGIKFTHRNRESVTLNDLFISPELKIIKDSLEDFPSNISSEKLWNRKNQLLIFGEEQSGKTTLGKSLFSNALSSGFVPLFIEGRNLTNSKIKEKIPKLVSATYRCLSAEEFLQNPNRVCIIDDLSANQLNRTAKRQLITNLNSIFPRVIFIAEDAFRYATPDFPELDDFEKMEILPFGHVCRSKLIEKWVALEPTEEADEQQIWAKTDELRLHVDSLLRKDIMPAKPFYILMLLQSFETMTTHRVELTAYGYYYQYLVYQALERHVKHDDIDTYLNVLSELGGALLESASESLDDTGLTEFFEKYSKNYLPVEPNKVINDLVNSFILQRLEFGLKFRYRYLFYFFAAKKLADSLHRGKEAKKKITHLVETIHLEKASNIILFLTHHSKDPWILDEILYSAMDIFSEEKEVTLEAGSLSFIEDFVEKIPALVLEEREAKQERLKNDEQKDLIEQYSETNSHLEESEDLSEFMAKVNKVFRTVEVCGQIIRNRLGSLERNSLELIYEESFSASLRFLSIFLTFSESVKEESIRKVKKMIEQNPQYSNSKIIKKIETFYLEINYTVILAMLYKIAFSLGSTKGRAIYIKVTENKGTPAIRLIQEIIELQFEKRLDFNKVEKLHSEFSKNPMSDRLLKQILLRHCYTHDIGYKERQKLANKLNISMNIQRSLSMASKRANDNF